MGDNGQIPSWRKLVPGNPEVPGSCFTTFLPWLPWLCHRAVGAPWLPWAKVSLALVGELCSVWSAVGKPWAPAKISPCVVSPDIALSKWIWSMLLTTRPSKAKGLPIILRWLLKFGFVLPSLHFYSPLTFHFPFPSVLCHVLPVSIFHLFMCLFSHFSHPLLSLPVEPRWSFLSLFPL